MRTLLALALVLAACSRSESRDAPAASDSPSVSTMRGPDQLVLRFPRAGGPARVFAYPKLDSLIWTSTGNVPPLDRVLAFDEDAGSLAAVDDKGVPVRIDLRVGGVTRGDAKARLGRLASADGYAVYGIAPDGGVRRLTPTGEWKFKPPSGVRDVVPQRDGGLLVVSDKRGDTRIWRLVPPDESLADSAALPRTSRTIATPLGDRLYFATDSGLIGVRSRDLDLVPSVRLKRPLSAVVTTPSGDRIYLLTEGSRELQVVDRYSERIAARIELPDTARELRMDATGRLLLARAARFDSAWVVSVSTDRIVGTVGTAWRADLPAVAPDGAIALLRAKDVVFVDGGTLQPVRRVTGGARDFWHFVGWNGFRPRSAGLDQPVTFGEEVPADSLSDSLANIFDVPVDTGTRVEPAPGTTGDSARPTSGFIVQFAAVRSVSAASEIAAAIQIDGQTARIVPTEQGGITIYRVVLGPFTTRAAAEDVARRAGRSYWVYEGTP